MRDRIEEVRLLPGREKTLVVWFRPEEDDTTHQSSDSEPNDVGEWNEETALEDLYGVAKPNDLESKESGRDRTASNRRLRHAVSTGQLKRFKFRVSLKCRTVRGASSADALLQSPSADPLDCYSTCMTCLQTRE